MSNLSGLPPTYAARALQAATQDVLVRIVQLPESLQQNSSPTKISGIVSGQNPDGSVKLQTDQGVISIMLKDKGRLPEGLKLEIDIPAGRPPQQANIRSVAPEQAATTNQPNLVRTALQQSQSTPINNPLQNAITASELKLDRNANIRPDELQDLLNKVTSELKAGIKPTTLNMGETIRLTSIPQSPSGLSSTLANTEADLIGILLQFIGDGPDTAIAQKLLDMVRASPFWNSPQGQTNQGQTLFSQFQKLNDQFGIPPQAMPTVITDPESQAPLPRQFEARIIASISPQTTIATSSMPSSLSSNNVMIGQIDAQNFNSSSTPILRFFAPNGVIQNYAIPFPASNVSHGQIIIAQNMMTESSLSITSSQTLAQWMKSGIWESLQDIIHTMSVLQPASVSAIVQNLPSAQTIAQAGPLGLILMSLFSKGHGEQWVPESIINILRDHGQQNILRALVQDQNMMARLENTPLPQEWRANVFPFWHDGQVHKLPLYFKSWDEQNAQDHEKRRKKMRFLFDLNLSRMGPIQVDGFFQGEAETPRLDMILRAQHQLSPPMQQKMKHVYTKAMERSNLNGELTFQFRPDQWIDCDEIMIGV